MAMRALFSRAFSTSAPSFELSPLARARFAAQSKSTASSASSSPSNPRHPTGVLASLGTLVDYAGRPISLPYPRDFSPETWLARSLRVTNPQLQWSQALAAARELRLSAYNHPELPPLTEEQLNQIDWADWDCTRVFLFYIMGLIFGGVALTSYYYRKEIDHFLHHPFVQEPYPYIFDRGAVKRSGWWPGRSCQFMEFNCFAKAYAQADKLLAEKRAEEAGTAGETGLLHHQTNTTTSSHKAALASHHDDDDDDDD